MIREEGILRNEEEAHPIEVLALGRTVMANERTLLAFLRTGLGLAVAGGGMFKLLQHPVLRGVGLAFIVAAIVCVLIGSVRYWQRKGLFGKIIARHETEL